MLAEVRHSCGKTYLKVANIIVAVGGEQIWDMDFGGKEKTWTKKLLRAAADRINEAAAFDRLEDLVMDRLLYKDGEGL